MAEVGFRYIEGAQRSHQSARSVTIRYFLKSSVGDVEGDDEVGLKDVLAAIASDALRAYVRESFEQLRQFIEEAKEQGLNASVLDFYLKLDLCSGWIVTVRGLAAEPLTFGSINEFQSYLIENYGIADVRGYD